MKQPYMPHSETTLAYDENEVKQQLEKARTLINRLQAGQLKGLLITVADTPRAEELTDEEKESLEAAGLTIEETSRVNHVFLGQDLVLRILFAEQANALIKTLNELKAATDEASEIVVRH